MNSFSGSGSAAVVSNCYQLARILAVSPQTPSCDSRRRLKYHADCKQYRNYYKCEYCPLKSKDRSPYRPNLIYFEFRSKPSLIVLSFAWTLTLPTNFNLLRQNIVFSYSESIRVSFSWLFHYFSFFFCSFTFLLIFTKIFLLLLFYYIFFTKIIFIFSCSGMFHVPGFIDSQRGAPKLF